ncbi:hypothetical protein JTE90_029596 [Oedothorax gibbosus]|uniref:Uncharacterized protein n=1 Tax=Oedothorax gibbosus TaxID=931172 RepID=A0AAV6UTB6_9ARAC|nr:hypothetical protein JTE90_029596 [Oedothorax gibbosus]
MLKISADDIEFEKMFLPSFRCLPKIAFEMDEMDNNIHSPQADKNVKQKIVWDLDISKNQNMKQSAAEILKKRKERFGEISPPRSKYNKISHKQATTMKSSNGANSDVIQKRKERFGVSVSGVDINVLKKRSERFGESVSTLMKKLEDEEKLKIRQARFSSTTSSVSKNLEDEEKMKIRQARFSSTTTPISPATVSKNIDDEEKLMIRQARFSSTTPISTAIVSKNIDAE